MPIQIEGYSILAIAGQGGMGLVYKAEQLSPRRIVAIKVLTAASADADRREQFRREAKLVAQLEHPHILPLYDFGEQEGSPYLVLRFLNGGTLAERLQSGALDQTQAVHWVVAIAEALSFAHSHQVIHKDIKPSNALLDEGGNVYLSDFGIASALTDASGMMAVGSAAYMSPEQGRGEAIDERADIYSLSVMLFEMLTGQKPYLAETAFGMMVRHINDPIPSAREFNPTISPALDDLIQWGMAKLKHERPQTAQQFAQLAKRALAQPNTRMRVEPAGATLAHSATTRAAPPHPPQKQGALPIWIGIAAVGLCVALVAMLMIGGVATAILFAPPSPIPTVTSLPTDSPPTAAPTPASELLADDFDVSGSGFALSEDSDGGVQYVDGALQFTVMSAGVEWFSPSGRVHSQDVVASVEVMQAGDAPVSSLAVICRWQSFNDYIAFAISADGSFSIWEKHGGTINSLVDWTVSELLAGAATNGARLTATCLGAGLTLEVNGVLLAQAKDSLPAAGDVALMAGVREGGALVAKFDNLRVERIQP